MKSVGRIFRGVVRRGKVYSRLGYEFLRPMSRKHVTDCSDVQNFCMFIGHPRSGHSIVRSVLDAHPNIVLADELHALWYVNVGMKSQRLFSAIIRNAERSARTGSWRGGYSYSISGQHQGSYTDIKVIGDKTGGAEARRLGSSPELLDQLSDVTKLPLRVLHVIRNPFDNIATAYRKTPWSLQHTIDEYFVRCEANQQALKVLGPERALTSYHEDFVGDPPKEICRLCDFLGVEPGEQYLEACASIVNPSPHQSRHKIEWPEGIIAQISERMSEYDYLDRYSFDEDESQNAGIDQPVEMPADAEPVSGNSDSNLNPHPNNAARSSVS